MTADEDRRAAQRLLDAIAATGHGRTWRRANSLLAVFGAYALTDDVRERIAAALAEAGIECEPPLAEANRHDTLLLSVPAQHRRSTLEEAPTLGHVVHVSEWRPGERRRPLDLAEAGSAKGIVWFDVDVLHGDRDTVSEVVLPHCRDELTREIVDDLFDADPRPKVNFYEEGRVRSVSTLGVLPEEPESGGDDPDASKAGRLVFEVVEVAAGDGWLVTTRHRSRTYQGGHEVGEGDPIPLDELQDAVERRWLNAGSKAAGDLGIAVLHFLAHSYRPAHRELYAWLDSWELDFDERGHQTEQLTLKEVRGLTALLRVRLTALARPERESVDAWFAGVTDEDAAQRTEEMIDRALRQLHEVSEVLRSSLDVLGSTLAQEQHAQGERLNDRITLITSILLVPTLVVGIYGANTEVPARDTWGGLVLLIVLMVLSAAFSYLVIRAIRRGREADQAQGRGGSNRGS